MSAATLNLSEVEAANLVAGVDGPAIIIPLDLVKKLGGDLCAAAFLAKAAFLTAIVTQNHEGWFFLPQAGEPWSPGEPEKRIFADMGSWQNALGATPDAQRLIRKKLREKGLLQEKKKGIPGQLHYKVNLPQYLEFRASSSMNSPVVEKRHINKPKNPHPDIEKNDIKLPVNPTSNKRQKEGLSSCMQSMQSPPSVDDLPENKADELIEPEISEPASKDGLRSLPPALENGNFKHPYTAAGVTCWNEVEVTQVRELVERHGEIAVLSSAKKIAKGGRKPLLSYVSKMLKGEKNENCKSNFRSGSVQKQQDSGLNPISERAKRAREQNAQLRSD